jgi:3-hydroxyanthranilate 3,4-dioxygenase
MKLLIQEWFYQIAGSCELTIHEEGSFQTISIAENEIFLLPPNIPHNPVRAQGTVGVVIERSRPQGMSGN